MINGMFHRPARSYPDPLPQEEVVIAGPPPLQLQQQSGAWLQYLLPAISSLGSVLFFIAEPSALHNPITLIAIGSIVVTSVLVGVLTRVIQSRSAKKMLKVQHNKYRAYLDDRKKMLEMTVQQQRATAERLHPPLEQLQARVRLQEYLWERRLNDNDFLTVRAGTGTVPLCCPLRLDLGSNIYVDYNADVLNEARSLEATYAQVSMMPVVISLRSFGALSICGRSVQTRTLLRSILCHTVVHHAPEDVRILSYFPIEATAEWSWLKWLPHTRRLRRIKKEKSDAPEILNMLANSVEDFRLMLESQVLPELERRRKLGNDWHDNRAIEMTRPHFIVIIDGFTPQNPVAQIPIIEELLHASSPGVSVICLINQRLQEPSILQARIEIAALGSFTIEETIPGGRRVQDVQIDPADIATCEKLARTMSPLKLNEKGTQSDLSQDIRLLDLLDVHFADQISIRATWQARSLPDILHVPIGINANGEPLVIDLKEAAHGGMGPHGLVVGATGSGKSELLRTMVTSLAITHSPELLNFVLVDFKGGASFADLAALPHVAGMITNLSDDLSLVDRFYAALSGEQERRQRMLREGGNLDNIRQYQAKYQLTPGMEPLPYLLIIVDEFAELLASRPEFLDLFIGIGRIGRSIGMHLLFATQRLEEGRLKGLAGHLRYRICLRTFSAAESSTMLDTPDAFYLPSFPGVGYFKVDTSIYEMFKTALITNPYISSSTDYADTTPLMREYTATGRLIELDTNIFDAPTVVVSRESSNEQPTDMDVIISSLVAQTQAARYSPTHQVWLPPLPAALKLGSVLHLNDLHAWSDKFWRTRVSGNELRVPVGLLDIPLQQAQAAMELDFSGTGGHLALVGAPQSGKSTFLRTLVTSFLLTHSPQEVQLYCIDLGGGLLRVFEDAPHVGAVCGKSERDKVRRVVRQMRKVIEEREFLFRNHGIDSMTTFRARRRAGELADVPFGDVFLIIDNFAQFFQEFDQLEPEITEIVAGGLTYGVHLIIATNRWAEIRTKLRDNIGTRLELRLNDPLDSEFGKAVASTIPVGIPGRGINKSKLQFQTALPIIDSSEQYNLSVQEALEALVRQIRLSWKGNPAPPIRMLPALVRWEDLPAPAKNQPPGVPVGLEEFRLDPLYIDLIGGGPHFIVLGDMEAGKTTLLRTWMRGIEQRYDPQEASFAIIDFRKMLLDFTESKHLLTYAYNAPTLTACVGNFKADMEKRVQANADVPLGKLRSPQRWSGRHYFLFVDDYESLTTASSSPLNPLGEYLLAGRDIGFHLVLTRRVGGVGRASFEPIFQRLREMGTSAIILSGDPQEGKILYGQAAGVLPPGRGYFVQQKFPSTLIQVALSEPELAS
ncbi:MAG TPA: type VII secretion protein EccCa [Ktedonosporobacter sp.]|jgi:S-DNA-T family DNA segregation ATPase FtsK/SpoIIIE|nr:type VII secretion protein EccCa [Ktedonosporobacter sp.]